MGVNKVKYGSSTLVDLTGDTVTPEALLSGYTAHNAAGNQIVGTGSGGGVGNPVGTIIQIAGNFDSTLTPQKSWYPNIPNSEDYLLCTGRQVRLADYNDLARYFSEVYGDTNYFGDAGSTPIGWFTLPNFVADFPMNGMLAIKAR